MRTLKKRNYGRKSRRTLKKRNYSRKARRTLKRGGRRNLKRGGRRNLKRGGTKKQYDAIAVAIKNAIDDRYEDDDAPILASDINDILCRLNLTNTEKERWLNTARSQEGGTLLMKSALELLKGKNSLLTPCPE